MHEQNTVICSETGVMLKNTVIYTFLYYINNLIYFSMILLKVSHSEIQILLVW